jgi:hypothetical protein
MPRQAWDRRHALDATAGRHGTGRAGEMPLPTLPWLLNLLLPKRIRRCRSGEPAAVMRRQQRRYGSAFAAAAIRRCSGSLLLGLLRLLLDVKRSKRLLSPREFLRVLCDAKGTEAGSGPREKGAALVVGLHFSG